VNIDCSCGCGKKVALRRLRANRLLGRHDRALDAARSLLGRELQLATKTGVPVHADAIASNRSFISLGENMREALLRHLHRRGPLDFDRGEFVRWQRSAFKIAGVAGR
jgi:hypothetical protein